MARPHATTYGHSLGARFLTRDPLEHVTRDPYGYGSGNPANGTDPTGLCGFLGDGPCTPGGLVDDLADRSPVRGQDVANFAGGVLDGLTMGNGEAVLRALPGHGEENVRWGTTESRAGTIFGVVLSIPLAVPAAARGLALGPGRLVIPEVIHSAWGGVAFFDGLNDLRQTHEFCQANPGAPCRDRYGPQIVQTVGGGWAGVGSSSLGGIASLLGMLWDACQ